MTKQLAEKDIKPLATVPKLPAGAEYGAAEDVQRATLIVLQGSNNPIIDEGKGKDGDIYDTTNEKVVVPYGKEVSFIPLLSSKTWQLYEGQDSNSLQWIGNSPGSLFPPSNKSTELYEDAATKKLMTRKQVFNWVVKLLVDDYILPVTIKMKGASYQHGKKLSGRVYEAALFGQAIYDNVYDLKVGISEFKLDNDKTIKAKHFVTTKNRNATKEEVESASHWFSELKKAEVKTAEDAAGDEQVPF